MNAPLMELFGRGSCRTFRPAKGEPWPWDTDKLRGKSAKDKLADAESLAKSICHTCPVKQECLEYGLSEDTRYMQPNNIYGEKTPEERAVLLGCDIKWISGQRRLVFNEEVR